MPEAGVIYSNLKPVTVSYDEEMALPQDQLDALAARPRQEGELDNQMLDTLDEEFAVNYASSAAQRWKGQERWMGKENEAMRLVNILHPHAVFRKLRRAGVDARIEAPSFYVWQIDDETGKPIAIKRERSHGRLWLHDTAVKGRVGISAWVWENGERIRKCVTSLQYPFGPEWSLMHFNEYDVPVTERYRGWRTAMLNLILQGVLTEREVNRAFGPVPLNDASLHYRSILYEHRMRRGILA